MPLKTDMVLKQQKIAATSGLSDIGASSPRTSEKRHLPRLAAALPGTSEVGIAATDFVPRPRDYVGQERSQRGKAKKEGGDKNSRKGAKAQREDGEK